MQDDKLQMTMLFDFFGELLTGKQHEYCDLYYNEDLSLSEIASITGITRQGVYDIITRASKTLMDIEQKTGVVARWRETRQELERAEALAQKLLNLIDGTGESADIAHDLINTLGKIANDN